MTGDIPTAYTSCFDFRNLKCPLGEMTPPRGLETLRRSSPSPPSPPQAIPTPPLSSASNACIPGHASACSGLPGASSRRPSRFFADRGNSGTMSNADHHYLRTRARCTPQGNEGTSGVSFSPARKVAKSLRRFVTPRGCAGSPSVLSSDLYVGTNARKPFISYVRRVSPERLKQRWFFGWRVLEARRKMVGGSYEAQGKHVYCLWEKCKESWTPFSRVARPSKSTGPILLSSARTTIGWSGPPIEGFMVDSSARSCRSWSARE